MNIESLERKITEAAQHYYEGHPFMSDYEFDFLVEELRKIDPKNKLLNSVGWGLDVSKFVLSKSNHQYGIVKGIDKVKSIEAIEKFFQKIKNVVITPKLDGISVVAYYRQGVLFKCLTRGDGIKGIDITFKMKKIIPQVLHERITAAVRGELILPLETWYSKYSDSPNPRNTAAGIAMRLSEDDNDFEDLMFISYKFHWINEAKTKLCEMVHLQSLGFIVPNYYSTTVQDIRDINAIPNLTKIKLNDSKEITVPIDGLVITSDDTAHYEVAFKTITKTAVTKIKGIKWNLTRTRRFVPVLKVDPVELSGATINNVTAYNALNVVNSCLGVGAEIEITRSGEVIPTILKVIKGVPPQLPEKCSKCGGSLEWEGVDLVCKSKNCNSTDLALLNWFHWIGKLEGLGVSKASVIFKEFGIKKIQDLYTKEYDCNKLLDVPGFGPSSVKKAKEMFAKFKDEISPEIFLVALNLKGLGPESCRKILMANPLHEILKGKINSTEIPGVSYAAIKSIRDNLNFINEIYSLCKVSSNKNSKNNKNYKIVVTGKLSVTRNQFIKTVSKYGIIVQDSIKEDTDYLITNNLDSNSNKIKTAIKKGIKIINELDFLNLMNLKYNNRRE